jgi:hypothetical protein
LFHLEILDVLRRDSKPRRQSVSDIIEKAARKLVSPVSTGVCLVLWRSGHRFAFRFCFARQNAGMVARRAQQNVPEQGDETVAAPQDAGAALAHAGADEHLAGWGSSAGVGGFLLAHDAMELSL